MKLKDKTINKIKNKERLISKMIVGFEASLLLSFAAILATTHHNVEKIVDTRESLNEEKIKILDSFIASDDFKQIKDEDFNKIYTEYINGTINYENYLNETKKLDSYSYAESVSHNNLPNEEQGILNQINSTDQQLDVVSSTLALATGISATAPIILSADLISRGIKSKKKKEIEQSNQELVK